MKHSQENRGLDQPLLLQRPHHPCLIPAQIFLCYSHLRKSCQMFGDQEVSKHWMGMAPNHAQRGRGTKCLYGFIVIHGRKQQGDTVLWTGFLDTEGPFKAIFPLFSCLGLYLPKKPLTFMMLLFLLSYSTCLKCTHKDIDFGHKPHRDP